MNYTPLNWYWRAEDGRIYSSAKQAIITEKDKDFVAWQQSGNWPTPWPKDDEGKETDEALVEVLAPYGLRLFPPTLDEVKQGLQLKVDELAGKERQKYITDVTGQSLVYKEKQDEAFAYSKAWFGHKNAPDEVREPNENDYPMLKAGIGVEGKTMIDVAAIVTQAYADWQIIGAAIEGVRLKTKMAISEAKTAEEAQAIFEAIEWPKNKKQDNTATKT